MVLGCGPNPHPYSVSTEFKYFFFFRGGAEPSHHPRSPRNPEVCVAR